MNCLLCNTSIQRGELLTCTICKSGYHYRCVNITSALFREKYLEFMMHWTCDSCDNVTQRSRKKNDTTARLSAMLEESNMSYEDSSVHNISGDNGETIKTPTNNFSKINNTPPNNANASDSISYENFRKLLKDELECVKKSLSEEIKQDIKSMITQELEKTIQTVTREILKTTDTLSMKQENIDQNIQQINDKIVTLETENKKLKTEIENLREKATVHHQYVDINKDKKIVIYGFYENEEENENTLIRQVSQAFHEILRIDINPYIENISRIGKRGYKRPLKIQLISERMTRYIIQNARDFKNTGLYISEYLEEPALKKRMMLREIQREARQSGKYAIIKGSKVYIDGKEYVPDNKADDQTPLIENSPPLVTPSSTKSSQKPEINNKPFR